MRGRAIAIVIGMSVIAFACRNNGNVESETSEVVLYEFGGPAQGTTYLVKYHGAGLEDYQQSIDSILQVIDLSLSTYIDNSTVSRFNKQRELTTNDPHFVRMLFEAKDIRDMSQGAFDPTVFPLVRAWGFGPEGARLQDSVNVDSLLQLVDWDFDLKISNQNTSGVSRTTTLDIVKNKPVEFDFNGIAQGYTVDVVFEFLSQKGVKNLLVEIGGEVRAGGLNDRGENWLIGVDRPDKDSERGTQATLRLDNRAVATSGNYRKYYEKDGKRYSHTIDPSTGYPVDHQLLSATVMASNCALADAFATVFMVLGPERSREFLNSNHSLGIDALFVYQDDAGQLQTYTTEGMRQNIFVSGSEEGTLQ